METRLEILEELRGLSPLLAGMEKLNVFTVPEGYFGAVSTDILACIKEEAGAHPVNVSEATVPQGYFENLAANILGRVKETAGEHSDWLAGIRDKNVFEVPEAYFDTLPANILAAVKETEETPAILAGIRRQHVFEVPDGYFDSLAGQILARVKTQQPAKVIVMNRRKVSVFMKYAVAAMFTGAMALGVFKFTSPANKQDGTMDPVVKSGMDIASQHRFDEELAKVSDADIVKYLEANNTDVDAALVANSVDENELPAKEDYITDDKTLDNYLNSIDLTDLKN